MSTKLEALKLTDNITLKAVVSKKISERLVKQGTLKVVDFELTDKNLDTIKLTLFGAQAESIKELDKIKITNARLNEFRGETSIVVPKWGSVTVEDAN